MTATPREAIKRGCERVLEHDWQGRSASVARTRLLAAHCLDLLAELERAEKEIARLTPPRKFP